MILYLFAKKTRKFEYIKLSGRWEIESNAAPPPAAHAPSVEAYGAAGVPGGSVLVSGAFGAPADAPPVKVTWVELCSCIYHISVSPVTGHGRLGISGSGSTVEQERFEMEVEVEITDLQQSVYTSLDSLPFDDRFIQARRFRVLKYFRRVDAVVRSVTWAIDRLQPLSCSGVPSTPFSEPRLFGSSAAPDGLASGENRRAVPGVIRCREVDRYELATRSGRAETAGALLPLVPPHRDKLLCVNCRK
ncbi:hypothetical protein EVAR_88426_1 [Eumeta japonica]|uniref:Uncharacterized protein n=1 Tax=Eumeta variegata TaxID=151549 RepID=A0A4C1Y558_EUMVA|nr:hypothetical protein EVAR_88426_1 [Eumeta japonica]